MKKYLRYLISGLVFFSILALVNYFLKLNWSVQVLLFATVIYIAFSLLSDIFIAKKFAKDNVKDLSEEEIEKFQPLLNKGVVFLHVPKKTITEQWDKQFDEIVSSEAKENAEDYSDQFRWHLFSFDLLPAITGDEAKAAFDKREKHELYLFFEYGDEAYIIGNANLITAKDIDDIFEKSELNASDYYFFDPLNSWTYIKPHEEELGPYFYRAE